MLTQGGRCAFTGEAAEPGRGLLPAEQWEELQELLADDSMKGLVISCESPLVYLTPAEVEQCSLLAKTTFATQPGSLEALEWEDTMDQV